MLYKSLEEITLMIRIQNGVPRLTEKYKPTNQTLS